MSFCRYIRNSSYSCISYIDTRKMYTSNSPPPSDYNFTWYLNNANSLLRKGNRPRPRESRPDIRVSDNCACVLVPTRKKKKQAAFACNVYVHGPCIRIRGGPILTIYSHVVTTHYVRTRFRDCFESTSRRRNVQRPSRKNVFTRP